MNGRAEQELRLPHLLRRLVGNTVRATNHPPRRALCVATPCYTVTRDRARRFVLDDKPESLEHFDVNSVKAWKRYQTYLSRTSPLERAEFYLRQMRERKLASAEAVARVVGDSGDIVRRHLRILDLPAPIRDYLRRHRSPELLRIFSARELLRLVRLGDPKLIMREFRVLLGDGKA